MYNENNHTMKVMALIMAGGKGERFWPRSREVCPKQFIDVFGCGKTMIQLTVERIVPMVGMENIYVVVNESCKDLIQEQLPELPEENILCEPVGRNTAPCIGLGAVYMLNKTKNEDVIMIVLAADHLIKQENIFRNVLEEAVTIAEEGNNIVTIGIAPDYPETSYGYIKRSKRIVKGNAVAVECFVEKPDMETAREYLKSGDYLWNSGMFVWKASTVLHSLENYMPDIFKGLTEISSAIGTLQEKQVLKEAFIAMRSESIDYGIMEKAQDIYVLSGRFGWDDVGSWLAIGRLKNADANENVFSGNVVTVNTKNCIIEAEDKLIATVGLEGIVVVDTEDVTLIGDKTHMGEIKNVLVKLRENEDGKKYL